MRRMKRGLLLLPLLALALFATACGSEDALSLDPVASAATKTSDAGSARTAFTLSMKMNGQNMRMGGAGQFDFDGHTGAMTMDMSSLLPAGAGRDGKLEMRMIGSKMYMRLPESLTQGQQVPGHTPWISIDLGKALNKLGLGNLDPTNLQQDPTKTLELLRASSSSVTETGKAAIRGVPTTRYTAKLDLRKSLEQSTKQLKLTDEQRAQLRRTMQQLSTQTGLTTIPVDVFVDGEGLLRRMTMNMKVTTGLAPFSMTQTTDFYDFGVDVDVKAPPASEVTDLTGLMNP